MFEIYLTSKGPQILEGAGRIAIMHAVLDGNCTFTEILNSTKLSKSSAFTFIRKLVDAGFLREQVSKDSCDSTVYSVNSQMIVCSVNSVDGAESDFNYYFYEPDLVDRMERWTCTYMLHTMQESGISLVPLLCHMTYDLGVRMGSEDRKGSDHVDAVRLSEYLSNSRTATLESDADGSYHVRLMIKATDRSVPSYGEMIAAYLAGYESAVRGRFCRPVVSADESGDAHRLGIRIECTDVPMDSVENGYGQDSNGECGFTLFWNQERYVPVTGDTYNRIVDMLASKSLSSQQIAESFGVPQSTVSGYLKTLEKENIICSVKEHKNITYWRSAIPVFDWKERDQSFIAGYKVAIGKILNDPVHVARYLFHAYLCQSKILGIDLEILLSYFGRSMGANIVDNSPGMDISEIFDRLSRNSRTAMSADFVVTSYSPFSVSKVVDYNMCDFVSECYALIYNEMICAILERLTGYPHRVKNYSVYADGNRGYRSTFLPVSKLV